MGETRGRILWGLAGVLGAGALWRGVLAVLHFRSALSEDDPSLRELAQVAAFVEGALASLLLAHAVAAAWAVGRELSVSRRGVVGIGLGVACLVAASFAKLPYFGAPGFAAGFALVSGAAAGLLLPSPWLSVYAGAALGGAFGFIVAAPAFAPFALLAVAVPLVLVALLGAGFGRGVRRISGAS